MSIAIELDFYLIRNLDGKFFRAKGRSGGGLTWVDKAQDAKVYTKLGQARSRVTYFAKAHPEYGVPQLIHIHVVEGELIQEEVRVKKAIKKDALARLKRRQSHLEWQLENGRLTLEETAKKRAQMEKELADIQQELTQ